MDRAQQRTIREDELEQTASITLDETLRAGSIVDGRYRLLAHLGEGGTGSVWRAEHLQMQSPVALKILLPELRTREGAITRFWQEARLMGSLGHPNIVRVLDVSPARAPAPYMAMELLAGGSLYRRLKSGDIVDTNEACRLMDGVLSALRCAHSRGIVHRDIKPENLLFGSVRDLSTDEQRSELKILDFGASILLGRARKQGDSLWGTPYYMSPEQAANSELDHRSDLYSAAVVLYEMLTGHRPHHGKSVHAIIYAIATEPATPITEYRPDLPPAFHAFFDRALARRPNDRFASAVAMRTALRRLTGSQGHARDTQLYMAVVPNELPLPRRRVASASHRTTLPETWKPRPSRKRRPHRQPRPSTTSQTSCTHTHHRPSPWRVPALISLVPTFVVVQWQYAAGSTWFERWGVAAFTWLLGLVLVSLLVRVLRGGTDTHTK